jgi:hypothetical protein
VAFSGVTSHERGRKGRIEDGGSRIEDGERGGGHRFDENWFLLLGALVERVASAQYPVRSNQYCRSRIEDGDEQAAVFNALLGY